MKYKNSIKIISDVPITIYMKDVKGGSRIIEHRGDSEIIYESFAEEMLEFVKSLTKRSCCGVCACISCDAIVLLRSLGLYDEISISEAMNAGNPGADEFAMMNSENKK